jgi:hypothetical protein
MGGACSTNEEEDERMQVVGEKAIRKGTIRKTRM